MQQRSERADERHFLNYSFFRLDPAWRRLDPETRERHKAEFAGVVESWSDRMTLRTFSTIGVRPDTDFLIWRITPDFELLQEMHTDLLRTELGAWLTNPYLYTATTKPSQYRKDTSAIMGDGENPKPRPLDIIPIDRKYIIVYPMDKKRPWYALSREERGNAMREHATIGRQYPGIKINTAYSFGIDDQEFMVAFETDSVHSFLDLMQELRGTVASQYTERDTPIFTCTRMPVAELLDALGGTPASVYA